VIARVGPVDFYDPIAAHSGEGRISVNYDGVWINGVAENLSGTSDVEVEVYVVQCAPADSYPCGGIVTTSNPLWVRVASHQFIPTVKFRAQPGHKYYAYAHIVSYPRNRAGAVDVEGFTPNALPNPGNHFLCIRAGGSGFAC
jgi:hypothetical protein